MPESMMADAGMMDASYGGDTAETPAEKTAPDETESVDEENAGATEVLIEKTKLPPGTKKGDRIIFEAGSDFGDEWSLLLVKEETKEPTNKNMSAGMEDDMEALDQANN